jgi:hypothetical protein
MNFRWEKLEQFKIPFLNRESSTNKQSKPVIDDKSRSIPRKVCKPQTF